MDSGTKDPYEAEGSSLDECTHAECLALYRESTESIRYAKAQQWKTLTYLTVVLGSMILISHARVAPAGVAPVMIIFSFVATAAVVSMLIIFQMWQSTEQRKLDFIGAHMSEIFSQTREIKSTLEANIHRFVLLTFMGLYAVSAGALTYLILARHLEP